MKQELPLLKEMEGIVWNVNKDNPRHHIWNNRDGNWWMHLTVIFKNHTTKRLHLSLKTKDEEKAIERRDNIVNAILTALAGEKVLT